MDKNKEARDIIFDLIRSKSGLKQDVCSNAMLNFKLLKNVLKEIGDDLRDRMDGLDDRVFIEYKDTGEYEAQLRIAGDVLIFHLHTNVFQFDQGHSVWRTSYIKENENRSYCGIISVYNFLNDSFKYNRLNDLGYMIARIFVNSENHFMVEGKRQLGFLYNDLMNSVLDRDTMRNIVESTVLYTLDFDLLVPPYDAVKQVSLIEIQQLSDNLKLRTGKRLGFRFKADTDEIETPPPGVE